MNAIDTTDQNFRGAGSTPPAPTNQHAMLTVAEVNRRVCDVIDKAIEQLDLVRLRELTRVYEILGSVTARSVILESRNPMELAQAQQWVTHAFGDCCAEPIIYLVCAGAPSAMDISQMQKDVARACGIGMERMARPIYVPNDNAIHVANAITAQIKYESRALAQLIIALRAHLKMRARGHFAGQADQSQLPPVRRQVSHFLGWLLSQSDPAEAPRSAPPPDYPTQMGATGNVPTPSGLSQDIAQALANRVALYQRRFANQPPESMLSQESMMQREMQTALKGADPMDVAAIACLMWDVGMKVTPTPPTRAPLEAAPEKDKVDAQPPLGEVLLTTAELAPLVKYDQRTIRELLVKTRMEEGVHYIRPFGGRKILFRWAKVSQLLGINPEIHSGQ